MDLLRLRRFDHKWSGATRPLAKKLSHGRAVGHPASDVEAVNLLRKEIATNREQASYE